MAILLGSVTEVEKHVPPDWHWNQVGFPIADIRWLNAGGCSARTRHPLKRINRGASFIRDSTASSGVSPQPSTAKSQVQQIRASPAMTRCRFSSDLPGYA